jgi:hypothetical protein
MTHHNGESTVTRDDPIVAEVRAEREAIAAAVHYDLDELVHRLQSIEEAERKSGRPILPPAARSGAAA